MNGSIPFQMESVTIKKVFLLAKNPKRWKKLVQRAVSIHED